MGQAPSSFQANSLSALPEGGKTIRRSKTRHSTRSLPDTRCVPRNPRVPCVEPRGRSRNDCGLVGAAANLPSNLMVNDSWLRNAAPYYVESKSKTASGPRSLDLNLRQRTDKVSRSSFFQRSMQRSDCWSDVASDMYRFSRNSHAKSSRLKRKVEERRKWSRLFHEENQLRRVSQSVSACSGNSACDAGAINHKSVKNFGLAETQVSKNGFIPSAQHAQMSQRHSANAVLPSKSNSCEKVIIQSLWSELSAERSLRSENDRFVQLLNNDLRTLKAQMATLNKQLEEAKSQTVLLNENSKKCTAECVQWEAKTNDLQKLVASLRAKLTSSESAQEKLRLKQQSQLVFYEKCLDEIANRMAEALVEHEVLKQECCRLRTRTMQLENERKKEQGSLLEYRSAVLNHAELSSSESILRRPCSDDIAKPSNSLLPPDTTAGEALCSRPVSFNIESIDDLAACPKSPPKNFCPDLLSSQSRGMDTSVATLVGESCCSQGSFGFESSSSSSKSTEIHSSAKQFSDCCSCRPFSNVKLSVPPEVSIDGGRPPEMQSSFGLLCEQQPCSAGPNGNADGLQADKRSEQVSSKDPFNSLATMGIKLELIINMLRAVNLRPSSRTFPNHPSRRTFRSCDDRDVLTVRAVNGAKYCTLFDDGYSTMSSDFWAELGIPFASAMRTSAEIAAKRSNGPSFGPALRSLKKKRSESCSNIRFGSPDRPKPMLRRRSSYPTCGAEKYERNVGGVPCKRSFIFQASTGPFPALMSNADLLHIPSDCIEALFSTSGDSSKAICEYSELVYGESQRRKSVSINNNDRLVDTGGSEEIKEVRNLSEVTPACDGMKLFASKTDDELDDSFDMPSFKDDLMSTTTSSSFSSDESDREMHTMAEWLKQLKLKKGHQKFGVVRYLPRAFRPSILRRDVFCRFGHQERDALASFDFLTDVLDLSNQPSDCQGASGNGSRANCSRRHPSGNTGRKRSTASFNQAYSSALPKRSQSLNDLRSTALRSALSSGLAASYACSKEKMRRVHDYCDDQKRSFGSLCSSPSYCSSSFLSELCAEQTCSTNSSISFGLG